jgi:mannose-6-phosphate isomerase-like protein (cupin superfamily)
MKIVFDAIEEQNLENFKGGSGVFKPRMHVGNYNKIMRAVLTPGSAIGFHTHDTNSEIIYVISGCGDVEYDDTVEKINPGECHYCPIGHSHSLKNNGEEDLVFFAVIPEHE